MSVSVSRTIFISLLLTTLISCNPQDEPATEPSTPSAPEALRTESLTLYNADTDESVRPLNDGDTLNLSTLTTKNLSIVARTSPQVVGSVAFTLDGTSFVDNTSPYAVAGSDDEGGNSADYTAWTPSLGSHTLTVTPFSEPDASGEAGTPLTLAFSVEEMDDGPGGGSGGQSGGEAPREKEGQWRRLSQSPTKRQEVAYVQVDGLFYLAGGSTQQEVYNPATDTWRTVKPLPRKLDHIQSVAIDGKIYYIGGLAGWPKPSVDTVYIYDPERDSFTQGAPMPEGRDRGAGGVAVYDGRIYYAGGLHDGKAVAWFDVYDPARGSWSTLEDMPTPRDHFQGAVVGGTFYAIGGRDTTINATVSVVEAYDFSKKTWSTLDTDLPTPRGGFATAVLGDEIFTIGGEGGGKAYDEVEAYNPTTNTWRTLAPMPTARHGIQAAVCNVGVYIAAGGAEQAGGAPTNDHEVLSLGSLEPCEPSEPTPKITKISWKDVADAPVAVTEAQGTAVEGKLYVFGGYTSWASFCTTKRSDVYDPATNTWERLPDMPEPWTHAGVAVDGDDIYLAGGYLNKPNCNRAEVATTTVWKFDSDEKTWSKNLPPLPEPRGSSGFVRVGRTLHFFGGTDTDREDKGDHWALRLDGGTAWERLAPLPNPRSHMAYVTFDDKIYVIGGQHCFEACAVDQRSVSIYDPTTDTWSRGADLPFPLSHTSSSTFVVGNVIVVAGGEKAHSDHVASVLAYSPAADTWKSLTPLPAERSAGVGSMVGNAILFSGGGNFNETTFKGTFR